MSQCRSWDARLKKPKAFTTATIGLMPGFEVNDFKSETPCVCLKKEKEVISTTKLERKRKWDYYKKRKDKFFVKGSGITTK